MKIGRKYAAALSERAAGLGLLPLLLLIIKILVMIMIVTIIVLIVILMMITTILIAPSEHAAGLRMHSIIIRK